MDLYQSNRDYYTERGLKDKLFAFQFRLNQLGQKNLQRFTHMVLRNPVLIKYFDKKREMVNLDGKGHLIHRH